MNTAQTVTATNGRALNTSQGGREIENTTPLEWSSLWAAMDAYPTQWIPTTEAMHGEMLNILPPRASTESAFLVGEPLRHDEEGKAVHACFKKVGNSYFARNLTVAQFRGVAA